MAIGRLQVNAGKVGKASAHAAYIAREGRYEARLLKGEALEATESGNMPKWAEAEPGQFWRAADQHERANGTTYREFEVALPRELSPEDRRALVRDWVAQEIGDRHAYQWAIHRPRAADGQDQPHAHIMFSERQRDDIERGPAEYFKRYNAKAPERGGARKGYGPQAGKTLSAAERQAELRDLRDRWAGMVNAHLERAGRSERIDMRSYEDRGIDRAPEPKQLPSAWRDPAQRATVLEFRAATRERDQVRAGLRAEIPDPSAVLADRRAKAERVAASRAERMAAYEQTKAPTEDQAKTPEAPAIEQPKAEAPAGRRRANLGKQFDQAETPTRDPEAVYASLLGPIQERRQREAAAGIEGLHQERRQWTQAIRDHQAAEPRLFGRGKWEQAGAALDQAGRDLAERERAAARSTDPKALEAAALDELRRAAPGVVEAAEAAKKEREAREQAAVREQKARDAVSNAFKVIAFGRERGSFGYGERTEKWRALPKELKERVEEYNRLPKEQREQALERIGRDPRMAELTKQAKEQERELSRSQGIER